jgi:hypothetical protein
MGVWGKTQLKYCKSFDRNARWQKSIHVLSYHFALSLPSAVQTLKGRRGEEDLFDAPHPQQSQVGAPHTSKKLWNVDTAHAFH